MTRRVALGVFGGAPIFRVSHPNVDVLSTPNSQDFSIFEDSNPSPPVSSGQFTFNHGDTFTLPYPQAGLTIPIISFFAESPIDPSIHFIPSSRLYAVMPISQDEVTFYNNLGESALLKYFFYNRSFV